MSANTPIRPSPIAPPQAPGTRPPPPPVIPTSYLSISEQRIFFAALFGFIEISKLWDTFAPLILTDPEPTWSSSLRIQGPISVIGWSAAEILGIWAVSFLRIPSLSPSYKQLGMLAIGSLTVNWLSWLLLDPSRVLVGLNVLSPAALGGEWYWNWYYRVKGWSEPSHLEGVHKIRLLPFSTATLNPLSLTYCIPPDNSQPLYIPVIFNNSIPDEVSYFIRSLEDGQATVEKVSGSAMKRSPSRPPRLRITDGDDDVEDGDPEEPDTDPLSALVLQTSGKSVHGEEVDISRLPSVKPVDSMALVPRNLASSQNILFITVNKPSVVTLKSVVDKRGDRFHITPHREAVIIECPTGGKFVDEERAGKLILKEDKAQSAELRCVGDEEVAKFQARGVGPLKVGWKKKSKDKVDSGLIEGIEEDLEPIDKLALARRDRVSKTHTVPLRVSHSRPGTYTLSLTSVTDALHNTYNPSGHSAEKVYSVIARPSIRFDCSAPVQLLLNQKASLPVDVSVEGPLEQELEVTYQYKSLTGETSTKKLKVTKKRADIVVSEPGTYTLLDVEGPCSGGILESSTCTVQLVPLPTMDMSVTTLHECAMDVGATAAFDFTGSPPFRLEYTEQRKGGRARTLGETFNSHQGAIVLRPEHEGEYTYTVHPLANVDLVGSLANTRRQTLYACSGDVVDVDVDARGIAPLKLAYLKSWGTRSENITIDLPSGRSKVTVPVPSELAANSGASGKLSIALLSIEDGNGCVRKISTPAVEVDIKRQKSQKVVVTEGEVARAQLRLTGEAPWEVTYASGNTEKKITVRDPNNHLSFSDKGIYRLVKVKDAQCEGDIFTADSTFEIDFKPRPIVTLQELGAISRQGSGYKHKGLCAGQEDQAALRFTGQAPFELGYRYTADGRTSKHILKSAQETGILHLATEPGHHRYDFMTLADGNYPQTDVSIVLEHDVHSRPSVSFTKHNSRPICLDSPLSSDAKIHLKGVAPFKLSLAVRKPASTSVTTHQVTVNSHDWTLDLLEHEMKEIGRHEVMITRVEDQSGCEQVVNDEDELRTTVEVVESARIVAVDERRDLCVGDSLDFLLQGKAPWTIEYEWLGKKHKVTSSASQFTRRAEKKGVFEVKSVALKDNQCKRQVTDMIRTVHPLPSAKITEGEDSLREGDEPAAFQVHFTGTAPYSFTYTRSEDVGVTARSKVVETQTIADIWESSYTISSSLPGDYAVTSVSDKYCRYPPITRTNKRMIE
ncbi:hypothetical protein CI109_100865 [Kwoniella shandongensis]|uniref:Nucleoporin POM152 n=1 Tax=Kwoniella shandongensis TaxID=1734106 RepID=A0AAJ8LFY0_9TREE